MTKVLVVDDEPSVLHSTRLLLTELGFEVVTTADASEVIPVMRRERPHVLLQDVRMPGLDLERLIERIRADPLVGGTPVLLFSASLDLPDIQGRVRAQGVLEKPFRPEDVTQAIHDVVRAARAA